jgi:putative phosphoesterase
MEGKKLLIIGDTHIPERARGIPEWMLGRIEKEKPFDMVVCTGDLEGEEVLGYFEGIAPEFVVVRGNMDWLDLPEHTEFEIGELKFLVTHGREFWPRGDLKQLLAKAKKLGADVLIHGHTHIMKVCMEGGVLFINPGSATASWSGGGVKPEKTFIIAEFTGKKARVRQIRENGEKANDYEI